MAILFQAALQPYPFKATSSDPLSPSKLSITASFCIVCQTLRFSGQPLSFFGS